MKSAKEQFEELGYEYSYDDGFIEYLKAKPIPDRINTNYIKFTKISFDKLEKEIFISDYNKDALCLEYIPKKDTNGSFHITYEELQAINKQVEELHWNDTTVNIDVKLDGKKVMEAMRGGNNA